MPGTIKDLELDDEDMRGGYNLRFMRLGFSTVGSWGFWELGSEALVPEPPSAREGPEAVGKVLGSETA